jgi:branched-chain amino acid transport system ATP-binding protein
MEVMLCFENVGKTFGALVAVENVNLRFEPGLIYSVIGPNGAGKSTLINLVSGSYRLSAGRIVLDDIELSRLKKHRISHAGISRTYQNIRLFDGMTVMENLEVAMFHQDIRNLPTEIFLPRRAQAVKAARVERCRAVLQHFNLESNASEMAANLPYGKQRLLEIARALVPEPRVLMLDEPAAGLNHAESVELRHRLSELRRPDRIVLIVDHDMNLVMALSDRIVVMHRGRVLFEGRPAQVRENPDVQEAYLGNPAEHEHIRAIAHHRQNRVRLRAHRDITRN